MHAGNSHASLPRSAVQSYKYRGHRFCDELNTPVKNSRDAFIELLVVFET